MKQFVAIVLALSMLCTFPGISSAAELPFIDDPQKITDSANSVVMLNCYDRSGDLIATGSGFACIDDGIIVTNYHVIDGTYKFQIQTENGLLFNIGMDGIIAWDKDNDIAILKTDEKTGMMLLPVGSAYNMLKGSKVIAIGSPRGLINSVSSGLFSGVIKADGVDYIQFDAAISHGSSGGALFNNNGEVIGITTWGFTDSNGLFFAVPIERVVELWEKSQTGEFNTQGAKELLEAEMLLNAGEYDKAKIIYLKLGNSEMANECDYQKARDRILQEEYVSAMSILEGLAKKNYSDSRDLLQEVKVAYVVLILDKNQVDNYEKIFEQISDLQKAKYPDADKLYNYAISEIYNKAIANFEAGEYAVARKGFVTITDKVTDHNSDYYINSYCYCAICSIYLGKSTTKLQYNTLIENISATEVKKALLYNHEIAKMFLKGEWRESHGLRFSVSDDGALSDGLPRVISGSAYWEVKDGILMSYTASDKTRKKDKAINIITKDQIEVYCYADGKTYILNRK